MINFKMDDKTLIITVHVVLVFWSSRWHLTFVGRMRWLKRNFVRFTVDGKAAIVFQMESQLKH